MINKRILVTGAGGFLGSYICKELLTANYEVVGLCRHQYPDLIQQGISILQCDLSNKEMVNKLDLSSIDAVIHCAAFAGIWGDKNKFESINFQGTVNLINRAKEFNIEYFVYTSSPSVVFGSDDIIAGDEKLDYPQKFYTHYARTKAMAEKMVLEEGRIGKMKTISLRPHLIWGPGDPHLIPRILAKARLGKLKMVGEGDNLVDIIYVENAAIAHVQALKSLMENPGISGNAYFIGQEKAVNLWSFINDILVRKKIDPVSAKVGFKTAYYLGGFFELLFSMIGILSPEPPLTRFVALQLAKNHYFSHAKAKKDFGYIPKFSIEEALEKSFKSN